MKKVGLGSGNDYGCQIMSPCEPGLCRIPTILWLPAIQAVISWFQSSLDGSTGRDYHRMFDVLYGTAMGAVVRSPGAKRNGGFSNLCQSRKESGVISQWTSSSASPPVMGVRTVW